MNTKEAKTKTKAIQNQLDVQNFKSNLSRSRSISVGTCFGGTTEIIMRGDGGEILWCLMQPVEVIELIHQLAANVGCHIHIQPRRDFASWRNWKYTDEELAHYRGENTANGSGHAPHVNDMAPHQIKGQVLPPPEQQPGLNFERKDYEPVATKKTVNRRSAKRAAASA